MKSLPRTASNALLVGLTKWILQETFEARDVEELCSRCTLTTRFRGVAVQQFTPGPRRACAIQSRRRGLSEFAVP